MKSLYLWMLFATFTLFSAAALEAQLNSSIRLNADQDIRMDFSAVPPSTFKGGLRKWSHDALIWVDLTAPDSPIFYTFNTSGKLIGNASFQVPGAEHLELHDFDTSPDHSIWLCGDSFSQDGRSAFFIAHMAVDGEDVKIIRTTPYWPFLLAAGVDGSVWTVGPEEILSSDGKAKNNLAKDVLRHFSSEGHLIFSSVPLSSVTSLQVLSGFLSANNEKVGWYSGENGPGQYTEVSIASGKISHFPGVTEQTSAHFVWGFALTGSGQPFLTLDAPARLVSNPEERRRLYSFDRGSLRWLPVAFPYSQGITMPMLEGSVGESLKFKGDSSTYKSFQPQFQPITDNVAKTSIR